MRIRQLVRAGLVLAVLTAGLSAVPARAVPKPHFVLFTGTYGFRHDGIQEEAAALQEMADREGFTLEVTEDPEIFGAETYRRVDGFILLQSTGLGALPDTQKEGFIKFSRECGAGVVGIHAAADSGDWPDFDTLLGSTGFEFHPHLSLESRENPAGRQAFNPAVATDVTIQVADGEYVSTLPWRGFTTFRLTDEIYKWKGDPRSIDGLQVVLSLDEQSHYWRSELGAGPSAGGMAPTVPNPVPNPINQVEPLAFPDDSPIAWEKTAANGGRVFYTNLGHNMATWERADFRLHVLKGIQWVAEQGPNRRCVTELFGAS